MNLAVQKIQLKIKLESNPKIVNFKIRSFIESIRDLLDRYERPQYELLV
jgi:hypothetical protein